MLRALRHRDFRLLWTGQAVSLLGDGTTLALSGLLGALTVAFLFIPGVRDPEQKPLAAT